MRHRFFYQWVVVSVCILLGLGVPASCHLLTPNPSETIPADARPDFALMAEAWNTIERVYVNRAAVKPKQMTHRAINGLRIPFTDTKVFEFKNPQRGDIIVFVFPLDHSKDFIKRVIGTEGEKVQIIGRRIYINDQLIDDPWGHFENIGSVEYRHDIENFGPVVVPKDSLFVMGDNRNNSEDSRFWGFLHVNAVLGKAFVIYFSWDGPARNLLDKVRWSRIGHLIH